MTNITLETHSIVVEDLIKSRINDGVRIVNWEMYHVCRKGDALKCENNW